MRGLILLLAALLLAETALADPDLTQEQIEQLELGDLLRFPLEPSDGVGVSLRAMKLVNAPPQQVWDVVRDCDRFHEFMPHTKHSEWRSEAGQERICFVEIDLPFPVPDVWSEARIAEESLSGGGFRRTWSMVRGTQRRNRGDWTVLPWGENGLRTLLIYFTDTDPGPLIPDFIVRIATKRTLPQAFDAIGARVMGPGVAPGPADAGQ